MAKIGKKDEFNQLKKIYSFLMEQVYESLSVNHHFLKQTKADVFHNFYFFFWDAINSYDFESDLSFSYHLKETIIDSFRKTITEHYCIHNIESAEVIKSRIKREKVERRRKVINMAIRSLSVRQKRLIYLHCYRRMTLDKCRNFTGCNRKRIERMLSRSYRRLYRNLSKVKKGDKKAKYKERVYKIYQERVET